MAARSYTALLVALLVGAACAAGETHPPDDDGAGLSSTGGNPTGAGGSAMGGQGAGGDPGFSVGGGPGAGGGGIECQPCSADGTQVLDCEGNVIETCPPDTLCGSPGECMAPCDAASANKSSVGCDYYAVTMNAMGSAFGGCFVAFVANTWHTPVKIEASWGGAAIDLATHARIPSGSGPSIEYLPYDPVEGVPPGEVAILFLANDPNPHGNWVTPPACPVPAAIGLDAHVHYGLNISTGRGTAFHITTDQPVVSYQMLPFNAAHAAATGATLLIPTSAWDTNYIAAEPAGASVFQGLPIPATMAIVAMEDGTNVTILPKHAIAAGLDVPGVSANTPITYTLAKGKTIEFIQSEDFSGSPIQSDKPIGFFAGHMGLRVPDEMDWSDHAEQQIPPVRALGHEYAVVGYRDRVPGYAEHRRHRIIGAVDGTTLTFDPPIAGAPTSAGLGTVIDFETDEPFVVKSQDKHHPFMIFSFMSGSGNIAVSGGPAGYGDSDFVRSVPGAQYLSRYVFFTDPTYPETNLVVVRRSVEGVFADVELDCAGALTDWVPLGAGGQYEYTRIDLSRHNFEPQGACDNGSHEMLSSQPFGLWVWGWGGPETRPGEAQPCNTAEPDNSCDVSYGYPAGENVIPINTVIIPPVPR